ncbi:O-antigen ligase family protein [candidate division KSB1 bacterium]|nr:O-antigen ligase family protein [candidate division KSB1 bacterium]
MKLLDTSESKFDRWSKKISIGAFFIFIAAMPFSISLNQSTLAIVYLVLAVRMIRFRKWLPGRTPLDWALLFYAIAEILALIFSIEFPVALANSKRLLLIPIIYSTICIATDEDAVKKMVLTFLSVMTVYALWGVFKYFYMSVIHDASGLSHRLTLQQMYMTVGGLFMISTIYLLTALIFSREFKWRLIFAIAFCFNFLALLVTYTRSSWLGFFSAAALIVIHKSKKAALAFLAALVIAFLFILPDSITDRFTSIFDPKHPNNVQRTIMWKTAFEIYKDYPITGIGDIDAGKIYRKYVVEKNAEIAGHFHSNLVHIAVTLGTLGLLAFLWLFIKIFQSELIIFRKVPNDNLWLKIAAFGSLAAFVGFFVNGLFEWNFGDAEVATVLWFTIGISLATAKILWAEKQVKGAQEVG